MTDQPLLNLLGEREELRLVFGETGYLIQVRSIVLGVAERSFHNVLRFDAYAPAARSFRTLARESLNKDIAEQGYAT
jgi:hypothetical protein